MSLLNRLQTRRALALAVALVIVGVSLGSALALHRGGQGPTDATWERIQRDKMVVVGIDPSFAPFGSFGPERPEGLDADLALALAERWGVEVRFVIVGYDALYDTLMLGYVDILISALRPDLARTDLARYSAPYFDAGQVFVGRGDLPRDFDDLAGATLAVELGAEGDVAARQALATNETPNFTLQRKESAEEALEAVAQGQADFALVDAITARLFARDHPALQIGESPLISDPYVMAVRRKDWRLYATLEQALAEWRANGQLAAIIARWL